MNNPHLLNAPSAPPAEDDQEPQNAAPYNSNPSFYPTVPPPQQYGITGTGSYPQGGPVASYNQPLNVVRQQPANYSGSSQQQFNTPSVAQPPTHLPQTQPSLHPPPPPLPVPTQQSHPFLIGGMGPVTPHPGPQMEHRSPPNLLASNDTSAIIPITPSSVVELRFRCKGLKTRDLLSESDPFLVLYIEQGANRWYQVGRTETVINCANPTFTTPIEIDYFFEEVQRLRVEVFDRDSPRDQLSDHDFLGCVEVTMGQLMSSSGQSMVLPLLQHASYRTSVSGHLVITAEEVASCAEMVSVQFGADHLDNTDGWFSKSDPFLNIYRLQDVESDPANPNHWIHVYRSPVIKNNLNPRWHPCTFSIQALCNGHKERVLKFQVMDWESDGRHQFIGETTISTQAFLSGETRSMALLNPKKTGKRYTNSGMLRILQFSTFRQATFAEYLRGGCEISLMVGIDYTASNGHPDDPRSLHYRGGTMNAYQAALRATGAILEPYDHDRKFPVYGFGALVNGQVDHCFPLTFNSTQPEVEGIEGILQAYYQSFTYVQLYGPTMFMPLIKQAANITKLFSTSSSSLKYFVLLILTDGAIMDMDATVHEIVEASYLPLSIVIVGVGDADFSSMKALDADGTLLRSRLTGRVAKRDIVQFVPFNQFRGNPSRLTKETLAEIPLQLTQHFSAMGITPPPPIQRRNTEILIQNATGANQGVSGRNLQSGM